MGNPGEPALEYPILFLLNPPMDLSGLLGCLESAAGASCPEPEFLMPVILEDCSFLSNLIFLRWDPQASPGVGIFISVPCAVPS